VVVPTGKRSRVHQVQGVPKFGRAKTGHPGCRAIHEGMLAFATFRYP